MKRSCRYLRAGVLLVAGLIAAGCGTARRSEPVRGPVRLDDDGERRGQLVFMEFCHKCHPGGEAGLGPALNNKPAPAFLVKFQVRRGLGVMPPHSEEEISDEELDDLAAYVIRLRHLR